MTETDARAKAESFRAKHEIAPAAVLEFAKRRYIELKDGPAEAPGPVRDALVWIVHFKLGISWTELSIDDLNGGIVRVERSRTVPSKQD